jgi:Pectate lyase superfamily protein
VRQTNNRIPAEQRPENRRRTRRDFLVGGGGAVGLGALASEPAAAQLLPDDRYVLRSRVAINVKDYGAVGDGAIDDAAAIQGAIAALPTTGGGLYFPRGDYRLSSPLNLESKRNVHFRGEGGPTDGLGTASKLLYTASGTAPLLNVKKTQGIHFSDLELRYTSTSFSGHLIDARNDSGDWAHDTRDLTFDRCLIGGNYESPAPSAANLVRLNNSHSTLFRKCVFVYTANAVWGRESSTDYCNAVKFDQCRFIYCEAHPVRNTGEAWVFDNSVFEVLRNGTAGALTHTIDGRGVAFRGCWFGDVTSAGSGREWIEWRGDGLLLDGGHSAIELAGAPHVRITGDNCRGITILGTKFTGGDAAIDFGTTTGHTNVVLLGHQKETHGAATPTDTAGTVPNGAIIYQRTNGLGFGDVDLVRALAGVLAATASGDCAFQVRSRAANDPTISLRLENTAATPIGNLQVQDTAAYRLMHLQNQGGNLNLGNANGKVELVAPYLEGSEVAEPSAPPPSKGRVFFRDNGAGNTQLCVRFASGATQVLATEP